MKRNSDRLLKILIVIATLIILGTLAVLAFLNFSGNQKNDKDLSVTTARVVTSSTNSTTSTETSSRSSVTSKAPVRTTSNAQPTEPVKTQRSLTLEEAIEENAGEGRGERVNTTGSKTFATQAEAHEYGLAETTRIGTEEKKAAFYVIEAVRDSSGKVVSWEVKITIN